MASVHAVTRRVGVKIGVWCGVHGVVHKPKAPERMWNVLSIAGWPRVRSPARGRIFFLSPKLSDRPWSQLSTLFDGYWRSFPVIKRPGLEADHSHLVLRLRMGGAPPLLPVQLDQEFNNSKSHTYLLIYLLHGVESFLRSSLVFS